MNKQEAIEEIKKQSTQAYDDFAIMRDTAIHIVNQIDEPQKVVVPKFVAEWLKKHRHAHTLLRVLNAVENEKVVPSTVNDWILDNQYDFIKAWIDGCDIEQEKLYTVEIPNPNSAGGKLVLFKQQSSGRLILDILNPNINKPKYLHLTESEIKQDFDFLWQFAKVAENDTEN